MALPNAYVPGTPVFDDPGRPGTGVGLPGSTGPIQAGVVPRPNLGPSAGSPNYVSPPNIGTAGSTAGGSFTQGAAMPNVNTVQAQATAAPSWYTDYLQSIAGAGAQAAGNAQFVTPTPLQQQSYNMAQGNVGNYKPTLDMATDYLSQVGNYNVVEAGRPALNMALSQNAVNAASPYLQQGANAQVLGAAQPLISAAANPTYNTVDRYMSPYINDVVSQIGNLAQQNIMQNVAPQTNAGIVGSGQFGSQRGAQALGQTLANYGQQTTAAQTNALNTGYQNAMQQAQAQAALQGQLGQITGSLAQNEAQNQLTAGQQFGNLTNTMQANQANIGQIAGNQASQQMQNLINAAQVGGGLASTTQALGLGDVNALNTLGTQQQQIAQAQQLFPLQMTQAYSGLLAGAQIPTSSTSMYTGPMPGAYQNSQLGTGLGTLSSLAGLFSSPSGGTSAAQGIMNLFGSGNQPAINVGNSATDIAVSAANNSTDPIGTLIGNLGGY